MYLPVGEEGRMWLYHMTGENPCRHLTPPGKMMVRQEPFISNASKSSRSLLVLLYIMLIKPQPSISPGEGTLEACGRGPYLQAPSTTPSLLIPFKTDSLSSCPRPASPLSAHYAAWHPHHLGITAFSFKPFPYQGSEIMQTLGKYYFYILVGTAYNNSCW